MYPSPAHRLGIPRILLPPYLDAIRRRQSGPKTRGGQSTLMGTHHSPPPDPTRTTRRDERPFPRHHVIEPRCPQWTPKARFTVGCRHQGGHDVCAGPIRLQYQAAGLAVRGPWLRERNAGSLCDQPNTTLMFTKPVRLVKEARHSSPTYTA